MHALYNALSSYSSVMFSKSGIAVQLCCSSKERVNSLPENMEYPDEIFCNAPTL